MGNPPKPDLFSQLWAGIVLWFQVRVLKDSGDITLQEHLSLGLRLLAKLGTIEGGLSPIERALSNDLEGDEVIVAEVDRNRTTAEWSRDISEGKFGWRDERVQARLDNMNPGSKLAFAKQVLAHLERKEYQREQLSVAQRFSIHDILQDLPRFESEAPDLGGEDG